jgi:hypothetical protein
MLADGIDERGLLLVAQIMLVSAHGGHPAPFLLVALTDA